MRSIFVGEGLFTMAILLDDYDHLRETQSSTDRTEHNRGKPIRSTFSRTSRWPLFPSDLEQEAGGAAAKRLFEGRTIAHPRSPSLKQSILHCSESK